MKARDESSFWRTASLMYIHGLGAAVPAERAAESAHRSYASLTGSSNFSQRSRDIILSPDYLDTLSRQSFQEFLKSMLLTSTEEE